MKTKHLAGALALTLLAGTAGAATIVQNGSFEDVTDGTVTHDGGSWKVYSAIPGWDATAGQGIEVQTNTIISAQDGDNYVELDSHPSKGSNSAMAQSVWLDIGSYVLSFWYSPRTSDAGTNGIEYSVGSLLSGSVTGPGSDPMTSVGSWTEILAEFTVETADNYDLVFAATGTENKLGGFVDNVSISAVPVPAAGVLLLTALGGLGLARRRKG